MKPNNKSVTLRLAALRPLQSLWTGCSTSHSRGILTEFLHEQGLGCGCDRKTSSSRLSDSGEEAKVKGTRKVGGMGKREKEAPALPSFLPFYFRVRAFSIQRPRLSKSLEQAKLFADVISKAAHFRQLFKDPECSECRSGQDLNTARNPSWQTAGRSSGEAHRFCTLNTAIDFVSVLIHIFNNSACIILFLTRMQYDGSSFELDSEPLRTQPHELRLFH